jgi:hypothetical protein
MSVIEPRSWCLRTETIRAWVASFVLTAPLGCYVAVEPERRSLAQNKRLHAMIADAVDGGIATDDGRRLTQEEAKIAFVSGWMIENGEQSDIIAFNGRPVQLRRSTTTFTKEELGSLMDYIESECAQRGIQLREPS